MESERRSQSSPIELTWLTIVLNLTQNWEDYEKSSLDNRIENLKTQTILCSLKLPQQVIKSCTEFIGNFTSFHKMGMYSSPTRQVYSTDVHSNFFETPEL